MLVNHRAMLVVEGDQETESQLAALNLVALGHAIGAPTQSCALANVGFVAYKVAVLFRILWGISRQVFAEAVECGINRPAVLER